MIRLGVRSLGVAGDPQGFPGHGDWPQYPRLRSVIGSPEAISKALCAHYPPLALRRLDAYAATALLAAKLALHAWATENPGETRKAHCGVQGDDPPAGCRAEPCQEGPGRAEPSLGLVVCTGRGPVPALNAFIDSSMDFGIEGASPTAFARTVHNVAASIISMFLNITGPTLTVSQPGLGVSDALCTIGSWLDLGLVQAVLFGAADDYEAFSNILEGSSARAASEPHGPLAVFAVLSRADAGGELLTVETGRFPPMREGGQTLQTRCPGPVDILSGFLSALAAGQKETILEEAYGGATASLRLRLKTKDARS